MFISFNFITTRLEIAVISGNHKRKYVQRILEDESETNSQQNDAKH